MTTARRWALWILLGVASALLSSCSDSLASGGSGTGPVQSQTIPLDVAAERCTDLLKKVGQDSASHMVDVGIWGQAKEELESSKTGLPSQWQKMSNTDPIIFCTASLSADASTAEAVQCPDGRILSVGVSTQQRYIVRGGGRLMWIAMPLETTPSPDSSSELCSEVG